jgi:hypothetical protein
VRSTLEDVRSMEGLGVTLRSGLSFNSVLGSEPLAAIESAGPVVSHSKAFADC